MSYRLVIAEDEDDIRNNLQRLLRMEGFEVWAGSNGRAALDLVRTHRPDLVLSDVMMPEMTGHQLVKALRDDPATAHVPVILLTARADRSDIREGMNLGADDYLTKPFQRTELLDSIRSRLDKMAAQQDAARKLAAQTHRLSHYDNVTDLPNRTHFMLLLDNSLNARADAGPPPHLWGVRINNLSQMAQVLGHTVTSEGVRHLSERLQQLFNARYRDQGRWVVGRLSEELFGVLVQGHDDDAAISDLGSALLRALSEPLELKGEPHFPNVSVAALLLSNNTWPPEALLSHIDAAVAKAREPSSQRLVIHTPESLSEASEAFRLHNDLHLATQRNELRALYQPQIDATTGALKGFEALMRWHHPRLGMVSPARFIPMAEDNGTIVDMGAWMLREACTRAREWPDLLGIDHIRVAVNVSLSQFCDPNLLQHVRHALDASGLSADCLEVEITEGTAMRDVNLTLQVLNQLKSMGVHLAIDDFGTGYSSLAYLKRFPLDVLKIDQSFVRHLCNDPDDRAIAGAVIGLAHNLDMKVIAEGVEQADQHALLRDMGCDEVQGYLHGKPMDSHQIEAWYASHRARPMP